MNSNPTQAQLILAHLQQMGSITPLQALHHFNCFRLGARVFELKKQGYPIETTRWKTPGGAIVAKYILVGQTDLPLHLPISA